MGPQEGGGQQLASMGGDVGMGARGALAGSVCAKRQGLRVQAGRRSRSYTTCYPGLPLQALLHA